MVNKEQLARLRQKVVNILAKVYPALASGAAFLSAWVRQAREAIGRTRPHGMARLRSTPWQESAHQYLPLLVGLGVLLLLFVFWKLPQWYAASWDKLTDPKDIAKLESETRTTLVQAVGGLVVLIGLFLPGAISG
jgi:hypothetical protein